ncbi:MAG: efflux RND transporter periplasmic adaptor subunit [Syntrophales bacterium]|jgi:RND family efflux transporter MFP subunit|nr:efflux RND transporter periplasmic adaptor subunit [Syntrophales bacterium]
MNDDKGKEKKQDKKTRILGFLQLVIVVAIIVGAFLLSSYLSRLEKTPAPERRTGLREVLVETVRIEPRTFRLRFTTTGTVQVRAMTDIVPQVSGRIVEIDERAFPGGLITEAMVLFHIEKDDYLLEVERMEAEVARAETQLKLQEASSQAAVAEWKDLNPNTSVPPLVAERPQLEEAKAALRAARARLKTARLNLSRTEFRLPFTGRVTEFQLEIGQYAVAGQSYGQVYRLDSLEINVPLEERQLDWLLEAEDPEITIESGFMDYDRYHGYVKRVAGKLDPQTRFSRAIHGLKEAMPKLVPDVFVVVHVIGPARENVWTLPLDALQENGGIWIVTPETELALIRPEILQINDEFVIARSNGRPILAVRGNLPEATEGTPVRLSRSAESGNGNE